MTGREHTRPHDSSYCGARKRQPQYPGETCRRPAGWGTKHVGFGRCKLHGGATPYRSGHYSTVMHDFHLPDLRWKFRTYHIVTLRSALAPLIPDPARREQLVRSILEES